MKTIERPVCIPYALVVFLMAAASSCSWWVPVCDRVAEDVACVLPCIVHVHATQGINTSASSEAAAAISGTLRVVPSVKVWSWNGRTGGGAPEATERRGMWVVARPVPVACLELPTWRPGPISTGAVIE